MNANQEFLIRIQTASPSHLIGESKINGDEPVSVLISVD